MGSIAVFGVSCFFRITAGGDPAQQNTVYASQDSLLLWIAACKLILICMGAYLRLSYRVCEARHASHKICQSIDSIDIVVGLKVIHVFQIAAIVFFEDVPGPA